MLADAISEVLPPGQGFIRPYVEYATQCGDAPEIYHVGVALTVFAGAVARHLVCPYMNGRPLVPNLYTLLVGPSRSSRKTASMDSGIDILGATNAELVIPIPGSYEELVQQVRITPSGLLTYREFAHFLKTTMRGYGEPIRTMIMDLFDWPPDRAYVRNLRKGKTVIEAPICLSMLSAIATDLLFAYTDTEEWTGGFFARMVILYGTRENYKMPWPWPQARDHLIRTLHTYMHYPYPQCGGFDPTAWTLFEQWSRWRDGQAHNADGRMQGFIAGSMTLAAKVALLYACDSGEPMTGQGWLISYESMRRAILFVEHLYLPSVQMLGKRLALGPWERDRRKVLDVIEAFPNGVTRAEVLKRARVSSELLDSVSQTLKEEGTIIQGQGPRGITYKLTPEAKIIPFPGGGGAVQPSTSTGTPP